MCGTENRCWNSSVKLPYQGRHRGPLPYLQLQKHTPLVDRACAGETISSTICFWSTPGGVMVSPLHAFGSSNRVSGMFACRRPIFQRADNGNIIE
ncbi:Uncharacterized protein HZ326_23285 [Fusarium oxysporum f. sp. albedinis]|nr:Uncharacterized protein HZ326_23285 [Fusarium oxysporum f. sp. albedinis]